jgi:hypothetical protein
MSRSSSSTPASYAQQGKLRHKVFPNNPDGFAQLSDCLNKQGVKQVHASKRPALTATHSPPTCTGTITS